METDKNSMKRTEYQVSFMQSTSSFNIALYNYTCDLLLDFLDADYYIFVTCCR